MRQATIGKARLINGDCRTALASLKAKSVDCVVTSPPYNIGIKYGAYHDSIPRKEYLSMLDAVAVQLKRVVKDHGSIFINVGYYSKYPCLIFDVHRIFARHFVLQNQIVWVKAISIGNESYGNFKPLNSERYLNNNFEYVFHFTSNGSVPLDRLAVGVPFKYKSNIKRFGHARDRRCKGNVWFLPYRNRSKRLNHPASYPISLPLACMKLHGRVRGTVLDPFVGSGTTLVAAEKLGLHSIGIEIDPAYFNASRLRLLRLLRRKHAA